MPHFDFAGITRQHMEEAIDAFRHGATVAEKNRSKSSYVFVDSDSSLWDLKALVVLASEIACQAGCRTEAIAAKDFNTRDFDQGIYRFGYAILIFDTPKARNLGVCGFDPTELNDEHRLCRGADQCVQNYFTNESHPMAITTPERRDASGRPFIRNTAYVRQVLESAKGICQSCHGKSFKMSTGGWYLEAHHKKWLSEGGPDSLENLIALCPNCHRQEHHGIKRLFF